MTAAHIRVIVPLATAPNRAVMRLLSTIYSDRIVNSKEERDRTIAWLRLPDAESTDVAVRTVRLALFVNGISDGVQVTPYQPRPDSRGTGQGSPWRSRREVIPRRPSEPN